MSTQSTLMQKKKAELVDIILRKDDVEKSLRRELNNVQLDFEKSKNMIANHEKNIKNLNNEIQELNETINGCHAVIDDMTITIQEEHHKKVVARNWAIVFGIIAIAAIVSYFIF